MLRQIKIIHEGPRLEVDHREAEAVEVMEILRGCNAVKEMVEAERECTNLLGMQIKVLKDNQKVNNARS